MLWLSCWQLRNVICSFGVYRLTNYVSFTPLLLYLNSSFGWAEVTFLRRTMAVMVLNSTDRLPLLYITKILYYFCSFFFSSFKEYCGLGSRVLDDWCGTVTLWGCCIPYNYTLFMCVIYSDKKKCTILVVERCTGELYIEVLLYNICDHSSCVLLIL